MDDAGRVLLAATPLGRPDDASRRLIEALSSTAVIAAEDTRRLHRLARDCDVTITGRVVSFFEANERSRVPLLLDALRSGQDVLVVTDAGMPSVSDPGYALVRAAIDAGITVSCLPGPSAVVTALAVSGLPVDRFCFEGFLPRKAAARAAALAELAAERRTMVFFEAPHRLADMLATCVDILGADRPAAVCRELTKTYEEVRRGPLQELAQWALGEMRGEITVVVAGAPAAGASDDPADLAQAVHEHERVGGLTRKEAIAAVAAQRAVPKRAVFDAVVASKGEIPR